MGLMLSRVWGPYTLQSLAAVSPHAAPLFDFWELLRQMAESEEGGRGDHRSVATLDSSCG